MRKENSQEWKTNKELNFNRSLKESSVWFFSKIQDDDLPSIKQHSRIHRELREYNFGFFEKARFLEIGTVHLLYIIKSSDNNKSFYRKTWFVQTHAKFPSIQKSYWGHLEFRNMVHQQFWWFREFSFFLREWYFSKSYGAS